MIIIIIYIYYMKIYFSRDTASVFHQFWTLLVLFGRPHWAPQACCTSSGHCWIPRKPMRQSAAWRVLLFRTGGYKKQQFFMIFQMDFPDVFPDDFSMMIFQMFYDFRFVNSSVMIFPDGCSMMFMGFFGNF